MSPEPLALAGKKVWVAGDRGMVGSAIVRRLAREKCKILTASRVDADLVRQTEVERWMADARPNVVIVAAAKVGGIHANDSFPADFLYENLMIEANIIKASHSIGVEKLLFLGSSCIYPRDAAQPITEDALLSGPLESTNEWYAIAKIAGIKLCQAYRRQFGCDFISAMPTNLYGPGDNYHRTNSHVIPALIAKIEDAARNRFQTVEIWGTGTPRREFMHVDDLADACVFLLSGYSQHDHINIGVGSDVSIAELARTLGDIAGFRGEFVFDASKPDGTPRKLMNSQRIMALGWAPSIELIEGLRAAYDWYCANQAAARH
jgi:GDP-L-fucose synthase